MSDGADWGQAFVDLHRPDAARMLDCGHADSDLAQFAQALHSEGTPAAAGLDAQRHGRRHDASPDAVLATAAVACLAKRCDQLRYALVARLSYPIGSSIKSAGEPAPACQEQLPRAAARAAPRRLGFRRERWRAGRTVTAVAETDAGPAAAGSHQPLGEGRELAGVATLPALRRRGIGAVVVAELIEDALRCQIRKVVVSPVDGAGARVYERLGCRRIATACIVVAHGRSMRPPRDVA